VARSHCGGGVVLGWLLDMVATLLLLMVDVLLSLLFLAFTYTRAIAAGVCRSGAGLSRQQSPQGRKEAAQCRNEMRHTTKRNGWYTKGGK
jgi:hypothetical protein